MMRFLLVLVFACSSTPKKLHVDYAFVADLDHSGIVRGIITTDGGQPAIGATLAIEHAAGEIAQITDENGGFAMTQALPEGKYTLMIYFGDTKASHPIEVRAGQVTVVRITNLREPAGGEILE